MIGSLNNGNHKIADNEKKQKRLAYRKISLDLIAQKWRRNRPRNYAQS
jgi:hypothetical protein